MTKQENAFIIANNALYFNDNSDYQTALYQVCSTLRPELDDEEIGVDYINKED